LALLLGLALLSAPMSLRAHAPSETYLTFTLTPTNLAGQWDVAVRDLQAGLLAQAVPVAQLSPAQLDEKQEALALDVLARLTVQAAQGPLVFHATDYVPLALNQGDYIRVRFAAALPSGAPAALEVDARALFAVDPNMHGLLRLEHDGRTETVSFDNSHATCRFDLAGPSDRWGQWISYVRQGVLHIWGGVDHILFLLALLFPSVLKREEKGWAAVARFRPALGSVVKIVTAFTVAHSLTLSLAAFDVVRLPSRFVESVIAASVALAALNNVRPVVLKKSWLVAFGFGLIHGFGFASVLLEAGWTRQTLVLGLVGFNVGVELGQLAVVGVFLPVAFALRASWFYRLLILRFGSVAVALVAALWMAERISGRSFMPF
jgi:hypothetical protein